jgi:two-component system, cell cycle response regulator
MLASDAMPAEDISLFVLSGPSAGQYLRLPKDGGTIGREKSEVDVVIDDPGLSRKHARFERRGPSTFVICDLESRYGIYMDGKRIIEHPVYDGNRLQLSGETVVRVRYQDPKETELFDRLHQASTRDPLTGVTSRRHFLERLDQELGYARRHGTPVTLLLIDLDHFKRINDEHGTGVGDEVLRSVGRLLSGAVRIEDVLARYGGDELAVLSRGYDSQGGEQFAERLRKALRDKPVRAGDLSFQLTLSVGIATFHRGNVEGSMQLIARADAALYRAKHLGRDQIATWTNA